MTANTAGASLGKLVNWNAIDWQKANQHVSRLQARIVKATQEGNTGRYVKENPFNRVLLREAALFDERLEGLSRMRENSHVRFLGEERMATSFPYPTKGRETKHTLKAYDCSMLKDFSGFGFSLLPNRVHARPSATHLRCKPLGAY